MNGKINKDRLDLGNLLVESLLGEGPGAHVLQVPMEGVQGAVVEIATMTIQALEKELRATVAELQRERLFGDLLISALHHDTPGMAKSLGSVRADSRRQGRFQIVTVLRDLQRKSESAGMPWDELRAAIKDACAKIDAEEAPATEGPTE